MTMDLARVDVGRMSPDDKRALLVQLMKMKAARAGDAGPVSKRESGLLTSGSRVPEPKKKVPLVGTALKEIFTAVGITQGLPKPPPGSTRCSSCQTMDGYLNAVGVAWCIANQRKIADYIALRAEQYMKDMTRVGRARAWAGITTKAVAHGILLDPRDLYFNIVGLAIKRAIARVG